MSYRFTLFFFAVVFCLPALAIERGVMLREGVIYVSPSTDSTKLSNIGRGREVAVIERGANGWANVMGTVGAGYDPTDPENPADRNVTGWIEDKGVILPSTPNGDKILFGEAFDSELEASKRGGRRGAAQDAMRLYAGIAQYFPQSPLAAESAYRAADIRWQRRNCSSAATGGNTGRYQRKAASRLAPRPDDHRACWLPTRYRRLPRRGSYRHSELRAG